MPYTQIPAKATLQLHPFKVNIPNTDLTDLKAAIQASRLAPPTYENQQEDRRFGVTRQWMKSTRDYWLDGFDWRKREEYMNSFPQYTTDITDDDGRSVKIHFVALFSAKRDAVPLVLLHGWPGSFLEFLPMLDLFCSKYPDAGELPYHIVVPSTAGSAFSAAPPLDKDFTVDDQARLLHKLMIGLGFGESGYVAQGGDTGALLLRILAKRYAECRAYHLNMIMMPAPHDINPTSLNAAEQEGLKRMAEFSKTGDGYAKEHGTRPSTAGLAIASSPLALLAWVGEKFLAWSDTDPSVDDILESVSLYWFTETFPRNIWHYRGFYGPDARNTFLDTVSEKPFGYSWFPKEIAPTPRAWAETVGNLVWYKQHDTGGHFAALERPEALLEDVKDFIAKAWHMKGKI